MDATTDPSDVAGALYDHDGVASYAVTPSLLTVALEGETDDLPDDVLATVERYGWERSGDDWAEGYDPWRNRTLFAFRPE